VTDARSSRSDLRVAIANPSPSPSSLISNRDSRQALRAGVQGAAAETTSSRLARYQIRVLATSAVPNRAYNSRSDLRVAIVNPDHEGTGYLSRQALLAALSQAFANFASTRLSREDLRAAIINTAVTPDPNAVRLARYQIRVLASEALPAPKTVWVWDGHHWEACPVYVWNGTSFISARSVRIWNGSSFVTII
jgi:hypothetical protein